MVTSVMEGRTLVRSVRLRRWSVEGGTAPDGHPLGGTTIGVGSGYLELPLIGAAGSVGSLTYGCDAGAT